MEYMYYMHTKVHIHCPTLFNIARKILCRSEESLECAQYCLIVIVTLVLQAALVLHCTCMH